MTYTEYSDAGAFVERARPVLEQREGVNGVMLTLCGQLLRDDRAQDGQRYLATAGLEDGPSFVAMLMPPRGLQLHSDDSLGTTMVAPLVDGLRRGAHAVTGVLAADALAEAFADTWCRETGARRGVARPMGLHELRQVVHPTYPSGVFRACTDADLETVRNWAWAFHEDTGHSGPHEETVRMAETRAAEGGVCFWDDGGPVAMAARTRPTRRGEAVALVYTPPERRGRGYASAVVARLSQAMLDDGKEFCVLYTDLANPTPNHIYRALGYKEVARVTYIALVW